MPSQINSEPADGISALLAERSGLVTHSQQEITTSPLPALIPSVEKEGQQRQVDGAAVQALVGLRQTDGGSQPEAQDDRGPSAPTINIPPLQSLPQRSHAKRRLEDQLWREYKQLLGDNAIRKLMSKYGFRDGQRSTFLGIIKRAREREEISAPAAQRPMLSKSSSLHNHTPATMSGSGLHVCSHQPGQPTLLPFRPPQLISPATIAAMDVAPLDATSAFNAMANMSPLAREASQAEMAGGMLPAAFHGTGHEPNNACSAGQLVSAPSMINFDGCDPSFPFVYVCGPATAAPLMLDPSAGATISLPASSSPIEQNALSAQLCRQAVQPLPTQEYVSESQGSSNSSMSRTFPFCGAAQIQATIMLPMGSQPMSSSHHPMPKPDSWLQPPSFHAHAHAAVVS